LIVGGKSGTSAILRGGLPVFRRIEEGKVMEGLQSGQGHRAESSPEVERVVGLVMKAMEQDVRQMAEAVVLKRDDELLGPGEFELREKVLRAACHILEATVNDRKKGGTKAAAPFAPTATQSPASSDGGRGAW
jgi:hypothetical protein